MVDWQTQDTLAMLGEAPAAWGIDPGRGGPKAEQIVGTLRAAIVTLRLKPGVMLSEQEVAARFDVSRQPVREAFILLATSGLVVVRPQRGTFIRHISLDTIADALFVREAVETAIATAAARRAEASDIARLEQELAAQHAASRDGDPAAFFRLDETFHRVLASIAGRPNAWRIIEDAKAQLDRVRYLTLLESRHLAERIAQHERIVTDIRTRRHTAAAASMRAHLSGLMVALPRLAAQWPDLFEDAGK